MIDGPGARDSGIEKAVGEKVRQLRIERGWSQAELSEKLDSLGWPMGQMTISRLEAGTRPLRLAEADALASAFGMTLVALLDDDAASQETVLRQRIAAEIMAYALYPERAR